MKLQNLFAQVWKNKWKIIQGLYYTVFKTGYVEDVSAARLKICNKCPFQDRKGDDCMVAGTAPCCKVCGCSLAVATRSLDYACPKGYWNAVVIDNNKLYAI